MTLDDELQRAGRDLRETSTSRLTVDDVRRTHRRRRAIRIATPLATILVAVGVLTIRGSDDESSVQIVDTTTTTSQPMDMVPAVIEEGRGPSTIVDVQGSVLATFEGGELIPGDDDLALALVNELTGSSTGARSAASEVFADSGLASMPDDAAAQLADAGLVIQTTISGDAQAAAVAAATDAQTGDALSVALWSIDPTTGATVALLGPAGLLRRNAGGAVRPAMMAVALESGVDPDERLDNPATLTVDLDGFAWEVINFGAQGTEPVTLAETLATDANTPWAGLIDDGRVNEAFYEDVAARFGFESIDPTVPSMVLGTFDADLAEITRMTAAFAVNGSLPEVHLISQVRSVDGVLYDRKEATPPTPIIDAETTQAVRAAMAQAVCCGTATNAELEGDVEQIGKTGTMPDGASGWFTGSTPDLTTAIWVGPMTPGETVPRDRITGGGVPASIWAQFTAAASSGTGKFPG